MVAKKINIPFKVKKTILALGTQTKNTICLARNNAVYLSPTQQNLRDPGDFLAFEKHARCFLKRHPKIIAYDLHPEYQSTKYALSLSPITYHLSPIQHHHAHIASCMVENGLDNQKVIGVAFDGTGLGNDFTLWGAEFLLCDYRNFQRKAHLQDIPLLGAEQAILQPWRLAALWLYLIYLDGFLKLNLDFVRGMNKKNWRVLKEMYLKKFNSPPASSMGRLFDAVASLVLARYEVGFEAELAMELERIARPSVTKILPYPFVLCKNQGAYVINPLGMIRAIARDLKSGVPKPEISYRFHLGIAEMIKKTCVILRKESRINKVALSGGVFQNKLLLGLTKDLLYKEKFKVFTHSALPCNDSCVSLGQAIIANFTN